MFWRCLGWIVLSAAVTIAALAATIGIFAVIVLTGPALGDEFGRVGGAVLFCAGLPLMFVAAAVVHEAGHVVAGVFVGFRPQFAHVGPITCTRGIGGWRLGWDWRKPWLGGRAVCTRRAGGRWRLAVFLFGGPLANLALGLIALSFTIGAWPALARCLLGLFAVHSLFLGAVNLMPLRERWLDSDGLALWRLIALGERGLQFHLAQISR